MTLAAVLGAGCRGNGTSVARPPKAAGGACTVVIVILVSALLSAPPRLGAQVLRNPETPYHFLRYDDVPSDQNSPYWPKDFWSPLKFFPLDIAPGSYINFGGGDRERVDTSATLSLASRHAETRLMTCIVFCLRAISISAILSGHSYNSAIIWQPRRARPRPLMSIVWTCSRGLPTCGLRSGRTGASLSGEDGRRCSSGRPGWSTFAKGRTSV